MVKSYRHPESMFSEDFYGPESADGYAKKILARFDLELADLEGKSVVDVGAGSGFIEQSAVSHGIHSVRSIERIRENLSQNPALGGRITADAERLPFKSDSVDLLLSNGGPISISHFEFERDQQIEEMLRVLKSSGEARVAAPSLRHVWQAIADKNPVFKELYPNRQNLSEEEGRRLVQAYNEIFSDSIEPSTTYLRARVPNLELRTSSKSGDKFWVIEKVAR